MKHNLIQLIALILTIALLWQGVAWTHPDIFILRPMAAKEKRTAPNILPRLVGPKKTAGMTLTNLLKGIFYGGAITLIVVLTADIIRQRFLNTPSPIDISTQEYASAMAELSPDEAVKYIERLGRKRHADAADFLFSLMRDDIQESTLRIAAADALCEIARPSYAVNDLERLYNEADSDLTNARKRFVKALPEIRELLDKIIKESGDEGVVNKAQDTIDKIDERFPPDKSSKGPSEITRRGFLKAMVAAVLLSIPPKASGGETERKNNIRKFLLARTVGSGYVVVITEDIANSGEGLKDLYEEVYEILSNSDYDAAVVLKNLNVILKAMLKSYPQIGDKIDTELLNLSALSDPENISKLDIDGTVSWLKTIAQTNADKLKRIMAVRLICVLKGEEGYKIIKELSAGQNFASDTKRAAEELIQAREWRETKYSVFKMAGALTVAGAIAWFCYKLYKTRLAEAERQEQEDIVTQQQRSAAILTTKAIMNDGEPSTAQPRPATRRLEKPEETDPKKLMENRLFKELCSEEEDIAFRAGQGLIKFGVKGLSPEISNKIIFLLIDKRPRLEARAHNVLKMMGEDAVDILCAELKKTNPPAPYPLFLEIIDILYRVDSKKAIPTLLGILKDNITAVDQLRDFPSIVAQSYERIQYLAKIIANIGGEEMREAFSSLLKDPALLAHPKVREEIADALLHIKSSDDLEWARGILKELEGVESQGDFKKRLAKIGTTLARRIPLDYDLMNKELEIYLKGRDPRARDEARNVFVKSFKRGARKMLFESLLDDSRTPEEKAGILQLIKEMLMGEPELRKGDLYPLLFILFSHTSDANLKLKCLEVIFIARFPKDAQQNVWGAIEAVFKRDLSPDVRNRARQILERMRTEELSRERFRQRAKAEGTFSKPNLTLSQI